MNSHQGEDTSSVVLNSFMGDGDRPCRLTFLRLSASDGGCLCDGGGLWRKQKLIRWARS